MGCKLGIQEYDFENATPLHLSPVLFQLRVKIMQIIRWLNTKIFQIISLKLGFNVAKVITPYLFIENGNKHVFLL